MCIAFLSILPGQSISLDIPATLPKPMATSWKAGDKVLLLEQNQWVRVAQCLFDESRISFGMAGGVSLERLRGKSHEGTGVWWCFHDTENIEEKLFNHIFTGDCKQRKECKSMQISHNQAEFILNPERGFKLLLVSSFEKISDLLLICLSVFEIYPTGNEDTSPTISGKFGKSTTQKCPKGWDSGWDMFTERVGFNYRFWKLGMDAGITRHCLYSF